MAPLYLFSVSPDSPYDKFAWIPAAKDAKLAWLLVEKEEDVFSAMLNPVLADDFIKDMDSFSLVVRWVLVWNGFDTPIILTERVVKD